MVNRLCLDKIEEWEITGPKTYVKLYQRPTWPGGFSGITIGIGYDLGYVTKAQLVKDWGKYLKSTDIDKLLPLVGLKGQAAKNARDDARTVMITYDLARIVFETISIPAYEKSTLSIYPTADKLPANVYGMLVSMVYNRGTDIDGDRRKEVKAIQALVIKKDILGIADQFLSMRRLWNSSNGLYDRYTEGAAIIKAAA